MRPVAFALSRQQARGSRGHVRDTVALFFALRCREARKLRGTFVVITASTQWCARLAKRDGQLGAVRTSATSIGR